MSQTSERLSILILLVSHHMDHSIRAVAAVVLRMSKKQNCQHLFKPKEKLTHQAIVSRAATTRFLR